MWGIDVRRGTRWFCVVASMLAVAAASAMAHDPVEVTVTDEHGASGIASPQVEVTSDLGPTANFEFEPAVPGVDEPVTFTSTSQASEGSIADLRWDFDADGAFDDSREVSPTWTFGSPGDHQVRLRAEQSNGMWDVSEQTIRVNGLPSADFTWSPASPFAGDSVDLISTSTDLEGPLAALNWDLDGDGGFGDASGDLVRQPFPEPGTYDIGLRVTDSDGGVSAVRKSVVVLTRPPAPPGTGSTTGTGATTGTGGTTGTGITQPPPPRLPRFMSPFPIVRIAGTVLSRGARIRILSVRAPRGSRVRMRCVGEGCPVGTVATTSATRVVRFHRFERLLRAGIRLRLFVRQTNRIGKYTSFLIRAGAPPKRVDLCLFPTRRAPGRCP
jgi:PKD repeat protein